MTLRLTVEKVHDTSGNTFNISTLSTSTLTVPAGKTKTVTLNVDLKTAPENIPLGGRVIAKNIETGEEIHVIFGILKTLGVKLKIKVIKPDGTPRPGTSVSVYDAKTKVGFGKSFTTDANGEVTTFVPKGYYFIFSTFGWKATFPENENYVWLLEVPVFEDTAITLDAREAEPVTFNMEVDTTVPTTSWAFFAPIRADGSTPATWSWVYAKWRLKFYTVPSKPTVGKINAYFRFEEVRGTTKADVDLVTSPVVYDLFFTQVGCIEPIAYTVDKTTLEQMALIREKHFSLGPPEQIWGRYGFPSEFYVRIAAIPTLTPVFSVPTVREST